MKTSKRNSIMIILLFAGTFAFSHCAKESANEGVIPGDSRALIQDSTNQIENPSTGSFLQGTENSGTTDLNRCIDSLPSEDLSITEIAALNTMREEELLAHDVYAMLYNQYKIPVFNNISKSETQHAEAVKTLLVKYGLPDPAATHVAGIFTNPELQALYISLTAQGSTSLVAAFTVGATIEDLDINDLKNHSSADVDNQDILLVFGKLEKGSRNHLRSFYKLLKAKGVLYTPQYITAEYFNQIISTPHETGSGACKN